MSSSRVVRVRTDDSAVVTSLRQGIAAIQAELEVTPEFAPEVEEAAARAVASPRLPDLDRTEVPFVTIDPDGARDLDQAVHVERDAERPGGYVVRYATPSITWVSLSCSMLRVGGISVVVPMGTALPMPQSTVPQALRGSETP